MPGISERPHDLRVEKQIVGKMQLELEAGLEAGRTREANQSDPALGFRLTGRPRRARKGWRPPVGKSWPRQRRRSVPLPRIWQGDQI